jgi:hypothetical protein
MVRSQRGDDAFEVVVENLTQEHDPSASAAYTRALAAAGATWFLEAAWMYMYETPGRPDAIRRRLRQGPPR